SIGAVSRNFCVRTGLTGVSCCGAPLYRTALRCDLTAEGSAGYLSNLIAPPPAERCGSAPKANTASITAVRHRREAIRARKMIKAERRTFFVFIVRISRDESQTGTRRLPAGHVARRTSSLRFRTSIRLYHFPNNASKCFANGALIFLFPNKPQGASHGRAQKNTELLPFSACRCRPSSSPWSSGRR